MGHINKIKTSNGQEYDVHDKRIIEVSAEDVGKVLTVESDGSLGFKAPSGGGTKLYNHDLVLTGDTTKTVAIITTDNSQLSYVTGGGPARIESANNFSVVGAYSNGGDIVPSISMYGHNAFTLTLYEGGVAFTYNSITDTVTEL